MTRFGFRASRAAVVLGLLVLPCAAGPPAGSMLKNPSFETPLEEGYWGCDMAAGWIRWGNWMNREVTWGPTRSGECLIGFHHWRLKGEDSAGFYQDVPPTERGRRYTFVIHAWVDASCNAESIILEIHSLHGGSVLARQEYPVRKLVEETWVPLSVSTVPPAEGLRVMVIVEPKKQGLRKAAIKFDDADLRAE